MIHVDMPPWQTVIWFGAVLVVFTVHHRLFGSPLRRYWGFFSSSKDAVCLYHASSSCTIMYPARLHIVVPLRVGSNSM